jgi:hypothetical protein
LVQFRDVNFYHKLDTKFSRKSLLLLHKRRKQVLAFLRAQQQSSSYEIPACTGVFKRTQGMPCAHELLEYLENNKELLPSAFNPYHCLPRDAQATVSDAERLSHPLVRVLNVRHEHLLDTCAERARNATAMALLWRSS